MAKKVIKSKKGETREKKTKAQRMGANMKRRLALLRQLKKLISEEVAEMLFADVAYKYIQDRGVRGIAIAALAAYNFD